MACETRKSLYLTTSAHSSGCSTWQKRTWSDIQNIKVLDVWPAEQCSDWSGAQLGQTSGMVHKSANSELHSECVISSNVRIKRQNMQIKTAQCQPHMDIASGIDNGFICAIITLLPLLLLWPRHHLTQLLDKSQATNSTMFCFYRLWPLWSQQHILTWKAF